MELAPSDMISKKDKEMEKISHFSVNACLMPVLAADGCHITMVEGVGMVKGDNLHPIQTCMVDMHGSQCGKQCLLVCLRANTYGEQI